MIPSKAASLGPRAITLLVRGESYQERRFKMKRSSAMVSGAGFVAELFALLDAELRRLGWTDEKIHELVTKSGKNDIVKMAKAMAEAVACDAFYTLTLAEQIAAGKYDWHNSDITAERFPVPSVGTPVGEMKLFHFDRTVETDEATELMEADGYEPCDIGELLNYGAKKPDEQRKYPIVALGSVCVYSDGYRCVAYLRRGGSGRGLGLAGVVDGWGDYCRFLARRKH